MAICIAIVGALSLFFKADQIFVTGTSRYSQQQVLRASGIRQGGNLFLLNKHQAASAITEQLPYVESVRIRRQLPNALRIEITECTHPLAMEQDGVLWLLNGSGKIIDKLLAGGYHVIIRPHPQSYKSEKDMIDKLMAAYPDSEDLEWNRDNDNFDVLRRADLLVSDFSGVIFDFTLVFDKPVIYADTKFDKSPYDCWWLDTPYWTFEILPQIGQQLTEDNFDTLGDMVQQCLTDPKYAQGRDAARAQTWVYPGEGAVRAADYLEQKVKELTATHEEKEP